MSDEFDWSASYTLSKTHDDASDYDEQAQNPFNLAAESRILAPESRSTICV
jgi:hypothetical protein